MLPAGRRSHARACPARSLFSATCLPRLPHSCAPLEARDTPRASRQLLGTLNPWFQCDSCWPTSASRPSLQRNSERNVPPEGFDRAEAATDGRRQLDMITQALAGERCHTTMPRLPEPVGREWRCLRRVLLAPTRAFNELRARPRWGVPFILAVACEFLYLFVFSNVIDEDFLPDITIRGINSSIELSVRFGLYMIVALLGLLHVLVGAFALRIVFGKLLRARLDTHVSLAIFSYSLVPTMLFNLSALVASLVTDPAQFKFEDPLRLNPVFLVGEIDEASMISELMYQFALLVNPFTIWSLVLVVIGVSTITETITVRKSALICGSMWVIYVFILSLSFALI